jgi:hypothetical protein
MKTAALFVSLILFLIVLVGALRAVFERRLLFIRKFDDTTRQAFIVLAVVAAGLLAWALIDLQRIQSFEFAGVKANLTNLQQRVDTLSEQLEALFKRKKIEVFDRRDWDRVRTVRRSGRGVILEVTLEEAPIPGSIEIYEGVLALPEQEFQVNGRVVQFPANTDKPGIGVTVKYYPRSTPADRGAQP